MQAYSVERAVSSAVRREVELERIKSRDANDPRVRNQLPNRQRVTPIRTPALVPAVKISDAEQRELQALRARDREVRSHEAAHLAAASGIASGAPSFEYQTGPDGQVYAVGGEVGVNTAPVDGDPEATLRKAELVRAAALAPNNPSPADRAAVATADRLAEAARAEIDAKQAPQDDAAPATSPLPIAVMRYRVLGSSGAGHIFDVTA